MIFQGFSKFLFDIFLYIIVFFIYNLTDMKQFIIYYVLRRIIRHVENIYNGYGVNTNNKNNYLCYYVQAEN